MKISECRNRDARDVLVARRLHGLDGIVLQAQGMRDMRCQDGGVVVYADHSRDRVVRRERLRLLLATRTSRKSAPARNA